MPVPFTEREKLRLRQKMLRAARRLFAEPQEPPDVIPELRQRVVVGCRDSPRCAHAAQYNLYRNTIQAE